MLSRFGQEVFLRGLTISEAGRLAGVDGFGGNETDAFEVPVDDEIEVSDTLAGLYDGWVTADEGQDPAYFDDDDEGE